MLLAMLLHASQGAMAGFLIPMFSGACNVRPFRLLAGLYVAVAIVVIIMAGPENLSRRHRKQEEATDPASSTVAPRVV